MNVFCLPRLPVARRYSTSSSSQKPPRDASASNSNLNLDPETVTVTPSTLPALKYISSKLQRKSTHVTLVMGGQGMPASIDETPNLAFIPVTPLDSRSWKILYAATKRATRKYSLNRAWMTALVRGRQEQQQQEKQLANANANANNDYYLIQQSILQNDVLFSQEGLTLLSIDRVCTMKRKLCMLSHSHNRSSDISENDPTIASCVDLLHHIVSDYQGRSFSKGFFHRVYQQIKVNDDLLAKLAYAYRAKYGRDGIVLSSPAPSPFPIQPAQNQAQHAKTQPVRVIHMYKQQVQQPPYQPAAVGREGVRKVPQSLSDFAPTTRNEWNILVASSLRCPCARPRITKWTPSFVVRSPA